MVAVALTQFGITAVALVVRYGTQPLLKCLERLCICFLRCGVCIWRWILCRRSAPCACDIAAIFPDCVVRCARGLAWLVGRVKLRWYWIYVAGHVGLIVRENYIIQELGGYAAWEVLLAHGATWAVVVVITWELWRFSNVRERSPKTVDMVIDMLLLPISYCLFCSTCVRVLKLQGGNESLVTILMTGAETWESWALWSVLEIFIAVVDRSSARDPRRENDAQYFETIDGFKKLSHMGVQAWVFILCGTIAWEMIIKGIAAVWFPTACPKVFQECSTCEEWYEKNINPIAQAVLYILCSFALVFVFYFERVFKEYLHPIEPFWKFWGVKGVVSVTFFQWVVFGYCLGLSNEEAFLLHTLAICAEMPLLALVHGTCAYPYGKPWLATLLDVDLEKERLSLKHVDGPSLAQRLSRAVPLAAMSDVRDDDDEASAASDDHSRAAAESRQEFQEAADIPAELIENSARFPKDPEEPCWAVLIDGTIWLIWCWANVKFVLTKVPTNLDIDEIVPLFNFTCSSMDLAGYVHSDNSSHWVLPQTTVDMLRNPQIAGVWLNLCQSTELECARGYRGAPTVTCGLDGSYSWSGVCDEVICGPPPKLLHAWARIGDDGGADTDLTKHAWRRGMHVYYECEKGFRPKIDPHGVEGTITTQPIAVCGIDGAYLVNGVCVQVLCKQRELPAVSHAKPQVDAGANSSNFTFGTRVEYECDAGYKGKGNVSAVCGQDGWFFDHGKCEIVCDRAPVVEHANLQANAPDPSNWTRGTKLYYTCNASSGFGGTVTATCGRNGTFYLRPRSGCKQVCNINPPSMLHAALNMDDLPDPTAYRHSVTVGTRLTYRCAPGYGGTVYAECAPDDVYKVTGECRPVCNLTTIPLLQHASPVFDGKIAQDGWFSGMTLDYKCDTNYRGQPVAACSSRGRWEVPPGMHCMHMGCGPLDQLLSSCGEGDCDGKLPLKDFMEIEETLNITSDMDDDAVIFRCKAGYAGRPLAMCVSTVWTMRGSCSLSSSPQGYYSGNQVLGVAAGAVGVAGVSFFGLRRLVFGRSTLPSRPSPPDGLRDTSQETELSRI